MLVARFEKRERGSERWAELARIWQANPGAETLCGRGWCLLLSRVTRRACAATAADLWQLADGTLRLFRFGSPPKRSVSDSLRLL